MHPAKTDRISALLDTSAQDAAGSLEHMLANDPAHTLEICAAALRRFNATRAARISHRKAFAGAARKALKQLEKEPLS